MFRHAEKLTVAALIGGLALVGAACEVEDDDPDVIEQTETDVVEDDDDPAVIEETETETETVEPTEEGT